ncbi:uncharacterized protein LOC135396475 [Ornithodoros turicata]|uniref:uncharacterized protein LOC135396475 n=1 Tax=Ornithodoros turicata TaxID=34597 RepID=UPI003139ABB8
MAFPLAEFVEAVRPHRFLYDRREPQFKDIHKKEALWAVIGRQFGIGGSKASRKWRNVRDKYYKLNKEVQQAHMRGEVRVPAWPHYATLQGILEPRRWVTRGTTLVPVSESATGDAILEGVIVKQEKPEEPAAEPLELLLSEDESAISGASDDEALNSLERCVAAATKAIKRHQQDNPAEQDDGLNHFGLFVAQRLRLLDAHLQSEAMTRILNILCNPG